MRGILDGHIVMERAIAERGRYPAINILKSVSRTMPRAADPDYLPILNRARQIMATYADMEELIRLGAYRPGSSAEVDEAIRLHRPLEQFLAQGKEEATSLGKDINALSQSWRCGNRKITLCCHIRRAPGSCGPRRPMRAGAVVAAASGSKSR